MSLALTDRHSHVVTQRDRAADRDASFAELYELYAPRLVALCRRRLPDQPEEAESIAQEAFARAWAAMDRYSSDRPFWPWVATIARRLCVDHLRDARRDSRIRRRTRAERRPGASQPDEVLVQQEEWRAAANAFAALSPRERRLITLRDLDGWSYEQIAEVEGVTVEAVRSALKRARVSLRRAYERP